MNGGPEFSFSPALSMSVACADQPELDRFWERLSEGGRAEQCGWLTDRFGVSWQVLPARLGAMLAAARPDQSERVMRALLGMVKLDIAALDAAYRGAAA